MGRRTQRGRTKDEGQSEGPPNPPGWEFCCKERELGDLIRERSVGDPSDIRGEVRGGSVGVRRISGRRETGGRERAAGSPIRLVRKADSLRAGSAFCRP